MMHGREKSDPAMVAEKSANKDGRPSAESAEPRAGPRETRDSAACAGLRAGKACPTGRTVYGKRRRNGNRNGSPPCYIMSMSTCCGQPLAGCEKRRRRVWTE